MTNKHIKMVHVICHQINVNGNKLTIHPTPIRMAKLQNAYNTYFDNRNFQSLLVEMKKK